MASGGLKEQISLFGNVRWEHCVAGVTGGVLSTLMLHPLDLIKIRFQVNEGVSIGAASRPQYQGIVHALKTIGKNDGLRGLYQGVTPNVWGAGSAWGLYFLFYNALKQRKLDSSNLRSLPAGQHMLAASQAGTITLVMTNPIWVAKTRLCLQYDAGTSVQKTSSQHYKGMTDCLGKIFREEGIRGWYRGFVPGLVGVSHGAVQFMTYEELKKIYNSHKNVPLDTKFNSVEYIVLAGISKVIAAATTYPYQVVRSRLQDQHRSYSGVWDVLRQTWKLEGLRGFYKGLAPYMIHVTPNICIVFLVYEHLLEVFQPSDTDQNQTVTTNTSSLAEMSRKEIEEYSKESAENDSRHCDSQELLQDVYETTDMATDIS